MQPRQHALPFEHRDAKGTELHGEISGFLRASLRPLCLCVHFFGAVPDASSENISITRCSIFLDASISTRFVPSHVSYPPSACCSGVGRYPYDPFASSIVNVGLNGLL